MPLAFVISLTVPLSFVVMILSESTLAGRRFPQISGWQKLGAVFFIIALTLGSGVPILAEAVGLTHLRVFELSSLKWWGLPLGLTIASLANCLWHRLVHALDLLWRITHQMHHSARRVDVAGAFFTHPFEVIAKTTISILVSTVFLGLTPEVASAVSSVLVVLSVFQHWNIKTPHRLGYFISRPEMHALHHEFEVHARNYSEFPIWDIVFGTFENPSLFEGKVGFDAEAASRLKDMLLMRDVNAHP